MPATTVARAFDAPDVEGSDVEGRADSANVAPAVPTFFLYSGRRVGDGAFQPIQQVTFTKLRATPTPGAMSSSCFEFCRSNKRF